MEKQKMLVNGDITFIGLISAFIFGLFLGGIAYLLIKILNLKNPIWFLIFFFLPPVLGGIIFLLSKTKKVTVNK